MDITTSRKVLRGLWMTFVCLSLLSASSAAQQTTKETIRQASEYTTSQLKGEVVYVEGNYLVVRMDSGEYRVFTPPESRRFWIDGKELSVRELTQGTKLTATIWTTKTSATERTTTVVTGKVWFVAAPNVILTLPNGENKMYKVPDDYRFTVEGRPATVFDLKKGMTVSGQKIVEEPVTIFAQDVQVTGTAPR